MPDWMLLGKGGLRECWGCGSDEEPCGLEDESIAKNENVDLSVQANVMVRGRGLIFSVVHLPPLTIDSPFAFTVLIIFFADTFRYVVW